MAATKDPRGVVVQELDVQRLVVEAVPMISILTLTPKAPCRHLANAKKSKQLAKKELKV